jgi:O-antigen ligase
MTRLSTRVWETPAFLLAAIAGGFAIAGLVQAFEGSPGLGVAALVGTVVVLASVQRLELGLFALVALTYSQAFVVLTGYGGVPSVAFPFVVLLLLFAYLARPADEPFIPRAAEPAVAAFALYGVWLLASAAWARSPDVTLTAVGAHAKRMLVVLAVLALVRSPRTLAIALWAVIGAATVLAGLTLAQQVWETQTFLGFARAPVPELTETGEVMRAVGPVGNPNAYAQMLVVAVPLALGRVLGERRLLLRVLALAATVLFLAAIYLTFSRGGFIGLAVVLVLSFFRYRPRLAAIVLGAGVVLLVAGGVSGTYGARVSTLSQALPWNSDEASGDPSIRSREIFLDVSLRIWRDHPLGGVGYANYPASYHDYNREVGTDPTFGHSAHNTPVEVLAETGVVGLAFWLTLGVAAAVTLVRARRSAKERPHLVVAIDSLAIALVGYLVTSLFLSPAFPMLYWLLLALCFSVASAVGAAAPEIKRPADARPR